jgi:hypothetical protein
MPWPMMLRPIAEHLVSLGRCQLSPGVH